MDTLTADSTWTDLETYVFDHDELKCESSHSADGWGMNDAGCSVVVAYRVADHRDVALVCASRGNWILKTRSEWDCPVCGTKASDCWIVTPI
jgi:predicted RNA-binding Zn-ribbon protein involved in translation (DUF1610 family)